MTVESPATARFCATRCACAPAGIEKRVLPTTRTSARRVTGTRGKRKPIRTRSVSGLPVVT
jgi:hypothetical protein